MYSAASYCIPQLAPPFMFNTELLKLQAHFVALLNKMLFTSCTTSASFTLGWVFIALTPTRNTPSLHVIPDAAEVQ